MKVCYERNGFTVFVMCFVLEPVRHWPVVVISPFRVLHLRSTEVSCINMKSGFRSGVSCSCINQPCCWYVQGFPAIHSAMHFLNNRHEYRTTQNKMKILKTCKKGYK